MHFTTVIIVPALPQTDNMVRFRLRTFFEREIYRMAGLYRAGENQWVSQIPTMKERRTKRAPQDVVPHVFMEANADGTFRFDILSGPPVPTTALARDTVRIPYVGGNISNGPSTEEVAINFNILDRPDLALGGLAVQEAQRFWEANGIEAAFYSQADAEEHGLSYLIGVAPHQHEVEQAYDGGNVEFEITSQGIVLATARVLVDYEYAQLPPEPPARPQ
jgi:hypothetical protein